MQPKEDQWVLTLDDAQYAKALDAHQYRKPIFVVGDLERIGQRWRMLQPQVLEDESEDTVDDSGDAEGSVGSI
jgi:hypothetical protein